MIPALCIGLAFIKEKSINKGIILISESAVIEV